LVARDADYQCGYCRAPQAALPYRLEIEHLLPSSLGGTNERGNLWLSCHKCNKLRSNRLQVVDPLTQQVVAIFNPRIDNWSDNFVWEGQGVYIVGRTPVGRATVAALRLNDGYHAAARSIWMVAGIYPPK
jgi:hypothetical protein